MISLGNQNALSAGLWIKSESSTEKGWKLLQWLFFFNFFRKGLFGGMKLKKKKKGEKGLTIANKDALGKAS